MLKWLGPRGSARRDSRSQLLYAAALDALALAAAVAVFIFYLHFQGLISAYESASQCRAPGEALQGDGCRYAGQVQVIRTSRQDGLQATVEFQSVPGRTFSTRFATNNEPADTLKAGTTVDGELWSGKVTRLGGRETTDNPEQTPAQPFLQVGIGLLVATIILVGLTVGLATVNLRVK